MWLLLSSLLGLGFAQEHVQDVYTTLSERYDDGMLQRAAIEGMLRADEQEWTNGIQRSSRTQSLTIGKTGNVVSEKGMAFESKY